MCPSACGQMQSIAEEESQGPKQSREWKPFTDIERNISLSDRPLLSVGKR